MPRSLRGIERERQDLFRLGTFRFLDGDLCQVATSISVGICIMIVPAVRDGWDKSRARGPAGESSRNAQDTG